MVLSKCFDQSFYSKNYVRGFLKKVREILIEGLGVEGEKDKGVKEVGVKSGKVDTFDANATKEMKVIVKGMGGMVVGGVSSREAGNRVVG